MSDESIDAAVRRLYQAVLLLENLGDCRAFFEDLCTPREIAALAMRLNVAELLREGKTYLYISEKVGASSVTISRVNRVMQQGNGYAVLDKLERAGEESEGI
jgi:TrpR-related protein YerC/YecD